MWSMGSPSVGFPPVFLFSNCSVCLQRFAGLRVGNHGVGSNLNGGEAETFARGYRASNMVVIPGMVGDHGNSLHAGSSVLASMWSAAMPVETRMGADNTDLYGSFGKSLGTAERLEASDQGKKKQ